MIQLTTGQQMNQQILWIPLRATDFELINDLPERQEYVKINSEGWKPFL